MSVGLIGCPPLEAFLLCLLSPSSGRVITEEKIQEAKLFFQMHFRQKVFDEDGWRRVLEVRADTHTHLSVPSKIRPQKSDSLCVFSLVVTDRNMMVAFPSGSKPFLKGRSFRGGTSFSLLRTQIRTSSGSPITLRYSIHVCYLFDNLPSAVYVECSKLCAFKTLAGSYQSPGKIFIAIKNLIAELPLAFSLMHFLQSVRAQPANGI